MTPVLVNPEGRRMFRKTVYGRWNRVRSELGLPHLHIHDLRHLSLTQHAQDGATLEELKKRDGHSSYNTVAIY